MMGLTMSDVPKLKASPNWTDPPREMRPAVKHRGLDYNEYTKLDMDMSNVMYTKTMVGGQERNYSTTLQMEMQEEMYRERELDRERERDRQRDRDRDHELEREHAYQRVVEHQREREHRASRVRETERLTVNPLTFSMEQMNIRTNEILRSMRVPDEMLTSDSEGSSS